MDGTLAQIITALMQSQQAILSLQAEVKQVAAERDEAAKDLATLKAAQAKS